MRLIIVGPANGEGGVGDYTEDIVEAARARYGQVDVVRTLGPGQSTVLDYRRSKAKLKHLLLTTQAPVVHFELSAGAVVPFWLMGTARSFDVPITATVHDPPFTVWWPHRWKAVAHNRILNHGLHYPTRGASRILEKRQLREVTLFALSERGRAALADVFVENDTLAARHYVPQRPPLPKSGSRPRAVGLYGHAYKGKGFDRLLQLREGIPDDIGIVVAGRGTEDLDPVSGVTILGPLDEQEEQEFFSRIRAILLPYRNESRYGEIFSVSGVAARAFGYETPVIASSTGTLPSLAGDGGIEIVDGDVSALAKSVATYIDNPAWTKQKETEVERLRRTRMVDAALLPFADVWDRLG